MSPFWIRHICNYLKNKNAHLIAVRAITASLLVWINLDRSLSPLTKPSEDPSGPGRSHILLHSNLHRNVGHSPLQSAEHKNFIGSDR